MLTGNIFLIAPAATAAAISTNVSAASAYAEEITAKPLISPRKSMQQVVSHGASRAMLHVARARSSVHRKDPGAAKDEIDKAERIVDTIDAELPATIVRHHIRVAEEHLDYETTERVVDDLVAIRTSLA